MKKFLPLLAAGLMLAACGTSPESTGGSPEPNLKREITSPRPQAFPGAEGFGKYASGGRNGQIYKVTNLNDDGPGSFRDAVSKPRRIVVFDVGGVIELKSPLRVASNITIAGQTAPGDGITVYGDAVSFSHSYNVICRYIRFRMGVNGRDGKDAVGVAGGHNMIFDHVSVSWGLDENFSISDMKVVGGPSNMTIQNSIIGQGLDKHSMGGLIQSDGGITLYRNLYIDNRSRNTKTKGVNEFVNNVVYNWEVGAYILGDSQFTSFANVTDNYFIYGPSTRSTPFTRGNENFSIYGERNYVDDNLNGKLDGREITRDEYTTVTFVEHPFDYPVVPKMSAEEAYYWVVDHAGCVFPARDQVDADMVKELVSLGTEGKMINTEFETPTQGPGTIKSGTPPLDSDGDGIPDEWEIANGLDPNDPKDANKFTLTKLYTNIEVYLNSLVEDYQ